MLRRADISTLFPYTTLFRSAFKCTFCYDRQKVGLVPACATACPTESIKFGEIESLRGKARERKIELHGRRSEEHTSELQSQFQLVCRLLLEKKNKGEQPAPP